MYTRHLSTNNHNLSRLLLVLHGAARHGHRDVVKILLERGAKTAATNKAGEAPWHVAERVGHKDLAKTLLRSDKKRKYQE